MLVVIALQILAVVLVLIGAWLIWDWGGAVFAGGVLLLLVGEQIETARRGSG